ncbi:DUF992 domain-containing protein [Bradyrhizobium sp. 143]|nr:DUF992 domain-containing protein [Bradyrhizobium sp. 143]MCK1726497.1 DUF992 domain-containing protein [Bradyrhizobium sp. 142]
MRDDTLAHRPGGGVLAAAAAGRAGGMLTCNLAPSIGLIVAESQRMSCRFAPNGPFPSQNYSGVMNTVGLELGISAGG